MASIHTAFTERFGVRHSLVQAGMAFAGGEPQLAIAVSRAGGIGSIGVGLTPPERLREIIRQLRAELGDLPFHVNFITLFGNDETVQVAVEERVPIVSFHWGHPPRHQLEQLLAGGSSYWEQVGSVEDAELAVADGAEVVIAQGWEAGGHNYGGLGTMALVPEMVDVLEGRALVLAAGGISDARGVAAALALGADGVWVGTRLVATREANVHPEHWRRLVDAGGADTVRSAVFGPELPAFNPVRVLRVAVVEEFADRFDELPTDGRDDQPVIGHATLFGQPHTKHRFDAFPPTPDTTGDFEEMAWLAGQGVGQVHDIRPAGEVVTEMMEGAAALLQAGADRVRA